ncbi:MAG: hypothetical protein K2W96_06790, partial [Gemmataceae bacterium]|nr:hypothetical protein [Gemmataceae bacterium]
RCQAGKPDLPQPDTHDVRLESLTYLEGLALMFQWIGDFFGWLASPFTSQTPARQRTILYVAGHVLFVLLMVLALWWINSLAGLDNVVRTRWMGLNRWWLPLVFMLLYALGWLAWGLYVLLGPEREPAEFDDIGTAWAEACAALDGAGIRLDRVPAYLVLGKPGDGLEAAFAAARVPLRVRAAPRNGPVQVFASADAVFVCCPGASLLPVLADRLLALPTTPAAETAMLDAPYEMPAEGALQPQAAVLLLGEPEPLPGEKPAGRRASLLKDEETADRAARRLRQVCRHLARRRAPWCPANGILAFVPLEATDSPEDATEVAGVLRHDLRTARAALQMDVPRFVVLSDLHRVAGFARLADPFRAEGGPARVLGQHFPLSPDVPAAEVPATVEGGLAWVADDLLPRVVGQLMRRDGVPGETDANADLYRCLLELRQRLRLLGRLAGRAVSPETGEAPMLAGAFGAGTGQDERQQAFLGGVLRLMAEGQDAVRWTPDALAEDGAYHRYAITGYVLLIALVAATAWLVWSW